MDWLLNIGFDLTIIALVLFILWLVTKYKRPEKATKWLTSALLALILGILALGYGGIKLANQAVSVPQQTQSEVNDLKSRLANHKAKTTSSDEHHSSATHKTKRHPTKKHKTTKAKSQKTIRVVNSDDNAKVANQVKHKHSVKVNLVAKVINVKNQNFTVRGVHSGQIYTFQKNGRFKKNQFIIVKGLATKINGKKVISVKARSVTLQNAK